MVADAQERIVFVNGRFCPESEAKISVFDHAVLYGDGVFDTCIAWRGNIFKLEQHLDRLFRSLAMIQLAAPYPREELRQLVIDTVRRNQLQDAYVKCLITRGTTEEPLLSVHGSRPGCIIFARPFLYIVNPERMAAGVRVKTSAIRRIPVECLDPRIKSLNYLNIVLAKMDAAVAGSEEAILLDTDGHVTEGPGYNIFAVHGDRLITPATGVLEGITRETVMQLAPALGLIPASSTLDLYDLYIADEVFLTSTAGGLIPVVEVDGRRIGRGDPGPTVARLSAAYEEALGAAAYATPIYEDQERVAGRSVVAVR